MNVFLSFPILKLPANPLPYWPNKIRNRHLHNHKTNNCISSYFNTRETDFKIPGTKYQLWKPIQARQNSHFMFFLIFLDTWNVFLI